MQSVHSFPRLSAEEAAAMIPDGAFVGFSGFTPAGAAKAVPRALGARARALHEKDQPFKIRVLTGASTGKDLDETLAQAEAISWRAPYQSSKTLRDQINKQQVQFVDMHLSHVPQTLTFGFFGKMDYAVVEATEITGDGRVYLSTSIGASPTFLHGGREGDHRDQPLPLAARVGDVRHRHAAAAAAPRADPDLRRDDAHGLPLRGQSTPGRSSASSSTTNQTTWRRSTSRPRPTTGSPST